MNLETIEQGSLVTRACAGIARLVLHMAKMGRPQAIVPRSVDLRSQPECEIAGKAAVPYERDRAKPAIRWMVVRSSQKGLSCLDAR